MYSAIPADGVYAAWFTVLGHGPVTGTVIPGERYQAAVSVGTNPTFSGRTRTVEAFVLDTAADLYGQHVALDFVARIRGQLKFDSVQRPRRRDGQGHRPGPLAAHGLTLFAGWGFPGLGLCHDRLINCRRHRRVLRFAVAAL